MQIFTPEQIREWDQFTIEHEPITSLDLMERAATRCVEWLEKNQLLLQPFIIFCGKGNNGGDGLAIARMLSAKGVPVTCYILEPGHKGTEDFQANLARLHNTEAEIIYLQPSTALPVLPTGHVIIDAIFGSGLNRAPAGIVANVIRHINESAGFVIAVDIPSGMYAGESSGGNEVVRASVTLSFQSYKLGFLLPENEQYIGTLALLDIGLHAGYLSKLNTVFESLEKQFIRAIYKPRKAFAHKGSFGHALVIGGSYGKIGAVVLSAHAALRSGAGLVSTVLPRCGYAMMQTALPEAMVMTPGDKDYINDLSIETARYNAIGIGPGLGTAAETAAAFENLLEEIKVPMVIDADALNLLAKHQMLLKKLPPFSILTPHPKEFERLFGKSNSDFERLTLAREKARALQVVIVLKGHHTLIAMPGGKAFFNSTGNPGMATGGSGDVLTGMLTGLLAQGYQPGEAALLGVYLHGLAGDYAATLKSQEAMIASDIINCIGTAFHEITRP